jgi:hypothetical protein
LGLQELAELLSQRRVFVDPYYFEYNGARLPLDNTLTDCHLVGEGHHDDNANVISMTPAVVGRPAAEGTAKLVITQLTTGHAVVVNALPTDTAEVCHNSFHCTRVQLCGCSRSQDVTKLAADRFGVPALDLRLLYKNKILPPRVALRQQPTRPLPVPLPGAAVYRTAQPASHEGLGASAENPASPSRALPTPLVAVSLQPSPVDITVCVKVRWRCMRDGFGDLY